MIEGGQSDLEYAIAEAEFPEENLDYSIEMYMHAENLADKRELDPVTERRMENARDEIIDKALEYVQQRDQEINNYSMDEIEDVAEVWNHMLDLEEIADEKDLDEDYWQAKENLAQGYEAAHEMSLGILKEQTPDVKNDSISEIDLLTKRTGNAADYEYFAITMAETLDETPPSDKDSFDPVTALDTLEDIVITAADKMEMAEDNLATEVIRNVSLLAEDYGVNSDILAETTERARSIYEVEENLDHLDEINNRLRIALTNRGIKSEELERQKRKMNRRMTETKHRLEEAEMNENLKDFYRDQVEFIENSSQVFSNDSKNVDRE